MQGGVVRACRVVLLGHAVVSSCHSKPCCQVMHGVSQVIQGRVVRPYREMLTRHARTYCQVLHGLLASSRLTVLSGHAGPYLKVM